MTKRSLAVKALGATLLVIAGLQVYKNHTHSNNLHVSSVMITNREMNHGGTGIVFKSTAHKSYVLTNGHVCKVVDNGGVVVSPLGIYQVTSVKKSTQSDLCMLTVDDNLKARTDVAQDPPDLYDDVKVVGHPALMPNIISTGHLSGRAILPVMMGLRPCTDEDFKGENGLICMFLGGLPQIRYFESVLVSATIMPGNSGSGVYNSSNKLIGVVFAGSGDFGYGWTVPYEQLRNFLDTEEPALKPTLINQEASLGGGSAKASNEELIKKCIKAKNKNRAVDEICSMISRDMVWRK